VKSFYCPANKLQAPFLSALMRFKNTPFRAYCMPCTPVHGCVTKSSKRVRVTYNNAYPILHYISRSVCVRPHHATHFVTKFDVLIRNNLYVFMQRWASSSNSFIRSLDLLPDTFYKSPFLSLSNKTFMYDSWRFPNVIDTVGTLLQCLFLFNIGCVYQPIPILCDALHLSIYLSLCSFDCPCDVWTKQNNIK